MPADRPVDPKKNEGARAARREIKAALLRRHRRYPEGSVQRAVLMDAIEFVATMPLRYDAAPGGLGK